MKSYRVFSLLALSALVLVVSVSAAASSSPSSGAAARLARAGLASSRPEQAESTQGDQHFAGYHAALSEAIVQQVNSAPNATWTAGLNDYFEGKSYEFLQHSCGTKIDPAKLGVSAAPAYPWPVPQPSIWPSSQDQPIARPSPYPETFDARERWGGICPSLHDIRDQAGCGSCWAVAAAESMTDRHCIASEGSRKPYLSAHHILTCCGLQECGSCEGGYPINAWQYWVNSGVVTGGGFGSAGTCQPYEWPPCEHHTQGDRPQCVAQDATPQCTSSCSHGGDFGSDKNFGSSAYKVAYNEEVIMNEIMTHGPVEAGFMVYEDFPHYKSGVYTHVQGNMVGGHAVKIMGWGVENGQKYWLAANSWNTNWGDQGFFKIAKGNNECMIEDLMFAGQVR